MEGVAVDVNEDVFSPEGVIFCPFWRNLRGLRYYDRSYALVAGYNTDYPWLLSREPAAASRCERHLAKSNQLGFDTSELTVCDRPVMHE